MKHAALGFLDSATPTMEGIIDLHHYIFFYLILILVFVTWVFFSCFYYFWFLIRKSKDIESIVNYREMLVEFQTFSHNSTIEIIWTLVPSLILALIAVPSFSLLYSIDEVLKPQITFKAIGHQWYWSYEFSDYVKFNGDEVTGQIAFDSNMLFESDLKMGELRLLNVDNPVILPTDVHVRILTTSFDVIHSWAVPSLGIKCDAVPGRLNQVFAKIQREGVFYGQCSELCGVNHGFMPIVIKAVSFDEYKNFISHQISNGS